MRQNGYTKKELLEIINEIDAEHHRLRHRAGKRAFDKNETHPCFKMKNEKTD